MKKALVRISSISIGFLSLVLLYNNCSNEGFSAYIASQGSESQNDGSSVTDPVGEPTPDPDPTPVPDPTPSPDPVIFQPLPPVPASTELCTVTASDSALKRAAREVGVGEWIKVPVTYEGDGTENTFFTTAPYPEKRPNGPHIEWADSATWDPHTRCMYFFGGGHIAQPAFVRLCEGDLKWSYVSRPIGVDYGSDNVWAYTLHGYDRNTIDPVKGIHYLAYENNLHAFDTRTQTWSIRAALAKADGHATTSLTYLPGLGVLESSILSDGSFDLSLLPDGTTTWRSLAKNLENVLGSYILSQYNPKSKVVLLGGGRSSVTTGPFWKLSPDGTLTPIKYAPEQIATSGSPPNNFVDDPASGNFIYTIADTGMIYEYLTSKDGWAVRGKVPFAFSSAKVSASIPGYDVIAYYVMGQGLWLYNPNRNPCP
jgi:hypothetical protein